MPQLSLHTSIGDLTVSEEDLAIVALDWGWGRDQAPTPLLRRAVEQLHAYFDGTLTRFDLPLTPQGTAYRRHVWRALCDIPHGVTVSYGRLASIVGGSARSVGQAVGANPVPVIIPCHRVLGGGSVGGYSGGDGLDTKRRLLALELGDACLPTGRRTVRRPPAVLHGA
ncbi:MAG: methylated-DNA--[protein]-cysteine S-methyltransferase [Acetobacteraceae bacterium]|nr:methylated-DNA--[protein]-cysteine S-methyltransferase [Acetobacteraceae bacterium]